MQRKTKAVKGAAKLLAGQVREPTVALPVCPRCGWEVSYAATHVAECRPNDGALAKRLLAALAPIKGTMHGFGYGSIAFDTPDGSALVFSIFRGELRLDHVFVRDLSEEKTIDVVRAVAKVLR